MTTTHTTESLAAQMAAMEKTLKEMKAAAPKQKSTLTSVTDGVAKIGGFAGLLAFGFVIGKEAATFMADRNQGNPAE